MLLAQARGGDPAARDEVLLRYREPLARFLHGKLRPRTGSLVDTEDLVQDVLVVALRRLEDFQYRGIGSFWAYLRRIGLSRVIDEERRRRARPVEAHDPDVLQAVPDRLGQDPARDADGRESTEAYEAALRRLSVPAREALILRLELGLPYELVARECGYASADAARMAVGRAATQLVKDLAAHRP